MFIFLTIFLIEDKSGYNEKLATKLQNVWFIYALYSVLSL